MGHVIEADFGIGIASNAFAFAYIKSDGCVITWGGSRKGGDSTAVKNVLSSGVQQIYSTQAAFAAVKHDGSVITWGNSDYGGDSAAVKHDLESSV